MCNESIYGFSQGNIILVNYIIAKHYIKFEDVIPVTYYCHIEAGVVYPQSAGNFGNSLERPGGYILKTVAGAPGYIIMKTAYNLLL
jgi:hypothetical protein